MKINFLPIFYPIFQHLCHFIHIWKITPFSTTILSLSGDIPPACATDYIRIHIFRQLFEREQPFLRMDSDMYVSWNLSTEWISSTRCLKISLAIAYFQMIAHVQMIAQSQ